MKKLAVVAAMLALAVPVSLMAEDKKVDAAPAKDVAQTMCPIQEANKINKDLFVDVEGKRVYVCCKDCIAAVTKDGAAIVKKLEGKGIKLEVAPKADAPKADAPKADAPKADAPKADAPKADAPKADAPKADAPKADEKKVEAAK